MAERWAIPLKRRKPQNLSVKSPEAQRQTGERSAGPSGGLHKLGELCNFVVE
jgi:hypothetical protein